MAGEISKPDWAQFVRLAWTSVIDGFAKLKLLVLSAVICSVALGFAAKAVSGGINFVFPGDAPHTLRMSACVVVGLLQATIDAAVMAPVAVAIHRFVILDEVLHGFAVIRLPCFRVFWVWMLCINLVLTGIDLIRPPWGLFGEGLLLLACIVLFARTLLIFPAIAVGAPASSVMDRIEASVLSTRRLFWTIFWATLVAVLPLALLASVPAVALMATHGVGRGEGFPMQSGLLALSGGLDCFLRPIIIGVQAAVASWIYLWVKEYPSWGSGLSKVSATS